MTLALWCAPSIHLAVVYEDLVVLDVENDRYDCLLDAGGLVDPDADGRITVRSPAAAQALLQIGVAVADRIGSPRRAPIPPRRQAALERRPEFLEVAGALLSVTWSAAVFRRRSLAQLVKARLPGRPGWARRPADKARLETLLAAERRARPWAPFEGECLQRTFQLSRFLARRGVSTDWVFGVRTWPFAAHCWLQIDDMVVGDRLERVARFTPIMRV